MRRPLKVALVLAVGGAIVLVILWQVLQSGQVRAMVEARLAATFGQRVRIGRLSVTFFPRPAIAGTDVRLGDAEVAAPALSVDRVVILPRARALFAGAVVVEQIHLDGFSASLLRDPDGGWHVPAIVPAPAAGTHGGAVVERVKVVGGRVRIFDGAAGGALRESSSIEDIQTEVVVEQGVVRFAPITGRIGSAGISGDARADAGAVRFDFTADRVGDEDLPALLGLLGSTRPGFLRLGAPASVAGAVTVDRATSHLAGKGLIRAPEVRFDPLRVTRLEAPFRIDGSRLQFAPTTFAIHDGEYRGAVGVQLAQRGSRGRREGTLWAADGRVSGLDLGGFLAALSGGDQRVDATASVTAAFDGVVERPLEDTLSGRVDVVMTNGVIRQFPLLAAINRVLRLAEQADGDTRFERLTGRFTITNHQAATEDLVLEAQHVRVEAAGRIGADRSLALRGTASVSAERSARAIASVRELSGLRNAGGEIQLPLTITGTLDHPSFGLDIKAAIGRGIRDELRRQLRRIIR